MKVTLFNVSLLYTDQSPILKLQQGTKVTCTSLSYGGLLSHEGFAEQVIPWFGHWSMQKNVEFF
jgi:hypothetical protein